MEELQCKTCSKVVEKDKQHSCAIKGPLDAGFDICAEVRKFLQEYDDRKKAEGRTPT